ncbi:leucine--tRNA ligase [Tsukamurella paurometabola]|uniref:Leucine--tRNA ligase n=1 Tax=Tsukamurella paurometabola TaxID=2061 RepID=A0A3P8MAP0_TSUPA|nr:leucine--tRNA ligase [Tsukamurella paurometabola]MBS4101811.1 leucine--tRNA ligase [Tsukamurella paurometabola]UEA81427.1 leucine--tRNA ligase [Tsukamurella paurometabola]VDR38420.1 Leucine--tRNA ligase [Tsukamurella paurometabola]
MTQNVEQSTSTGPAHRYTAELAGAIEQRWRDQWRAGGVFNAPNPVGPLAAAAGELPAEKLFILDMFPYPSGAGLHVGHPLGFIATDVFGRYHRMNGANVLHTMGFDAFGLPAEQYAVQTGTHPRVTTEKNIERYLQQIGSLGLAHDERRRVSTTDPEFYHWTQWIFLQIYNAWYDSAQDRARPIAELEAEFASGARALDDGRQWADLTAAERGAVLDEHRLVYESNSLVNWCPGLGTVLANEEVTADGRSERGNFPVYRKQLRQWMMRITAYSDRLIDDLDVLDWPEKVKSMQRNWIGRSRGARVAFTAAGERIEVFTTRPDTLFGATYMVLSPEHPLVDELTADAWPSGTDDRWTGGAATPAEAVAAYRASIAAKSDLERQEGKEKTGVFLGTVAVNPLSGTEIPVFIGDYVLMGYGTGAIMAVPGHDVRDHEFATKFGLPIVEVVGSDAGVADEAYIGEGPAVNSANAELDINGLGVAEAKAAVIAYLEKTGAGRGTVQYKLRDWLFARQRYWGEPFPIVFDADGAPHALPESELAVLLPEVKDYAPVAFDPEDSDSQPSPPLAKATDWLHVELDLGDGLKDYTRDANVMPQWAGSSWYQLRYVDPTNAEAFCAKENEAYWMGPRPEVNGAGDPGGVDLYVGGVEHAVLHLLYARFWHKVLFDLGYVTSREPYRKLFNQGMIQAYAYTDSRGVYVPAEDVVERDGRFFLGEQEVNREYGKMGKSLKNSVAPDDIARDYGADTLRVYEMSMGPLDQDRAWATKDVVGAQRFLQRAWRAVIDEETGAVRVTDETPSDESMRVLHKTIAGVREDYAEMRDNTAIAKLIELTNHLTKAYPGGAPRVLAEPLVLMLAPVAPHIAEELWNRLGHTESLAHGPFPVAEGQWLVQDTVEIPVQVKGKVRSRITVGADASDEALEAAALADPKIAELLDGAPRKVIVVSGKLVNIVP